MDGLHFLFPLHEGRSTSSMLEREVSFRNGACTTRTLLCSSLFIHAPAPRSSSSPPSFLDAPPSARRLRGGRPTFLCALHSLVHSCKISTRTRLRSLPPSLAFSLSCTHASHALPLTQACNSPETPQVHTDRRQRSRWASNAESWCRGGHRQFACMSQVTTWAWLLLLHASQM